MSPDKGKEVDFIVVRTMTEQELVSLLLTRFPAMQDIVCVHKADLELPTVVYDSFAEIVRARSDDPGFIQSVAKFIDELAESKGALVREVLTACLLEGIAVDEQLARRISRGISPRARGLLHEVERSFYGRTPPE